MICYRPGAFTSRVRSAVGLLLLLTLSSMLVCGADFVASSSSAERTATTASDAAFDRDVAVLPAVAEEAKDDAMARDLDLRRAEDADSSLSKRHRSLAYIPFTDDTSSAPLSAGNPSTLSCGGGGLSTCINGCRSRFYKVTGGVTGGYIAATTCGTTNFAQRLYVWKGTSSDCSTFTCTGTFAACFGFV
jgi:hypothetical protein